MTLRLLSGVPHRRDPLRNHKVWLYLFPRDASKFWILYCLSTKDHGLLPICVCTYIHTHPDYESLWFILLIVTARFILMICANFRAKTLLSVRMFFITKPEHWTQLVWTVNVLLPLTGTLVENSCRLRVKAEWSVQFIFKSYLSLSGLAFHLVLPTPITRYWEQSQVPYTGMLLLERERQTASISTFSREGHSLLNPCPARFLSYILGPSYHLLTSNYHSIWTVVFLYFVDNYYLLWQDLIHSFIVS